MPTIQEKEQTQTKSQRRWWLRGALLVIGAVVLAGCAAPFVNAARFAGSIQHALESSLGRKVEFEKVHFTLFSGPGFSLERVTIGEDPRYGLEPFAFVPVLQARVRLDRLLFGEIRLSGLRLVDPSLNFVRGRDGTWNVVELVTRLTAPRHAPLNLFPTFEVSDGRLDFKLGNRKTTLYIADSDLTVYPARSGKVYVEFSGSPARTDRAGNGFGHFRASLNWALSQGSGPGKLAGDVTLDPSNLSELATLFQGHDLGVHGTVGSTAHIEGPLDRLTIGGELRLEDVHRWDLLPSSGENWRIRYQGDADLRAQHLAFTTVPSPGSQAPAPVTVQVRANNFLARSDWSVFAQLNRAPLADLLPLAKRMGLTIPQEARLEGTLEGVIGFSSSSGLQGGVGISNAAASLPGIPPLRSAEAHATISGDHMHFDPALIETEFGGTLEASGDYYLTNPNVDALLTVTDFPVRELRRTFNEWFEPAAAFSALSEGELSGRFEYSHALAAPDSGSPASWSGEFQFTNATLLMPGLAVPLAHAQGSVLFDPATFSLERMSAKLGDETIRATYHYNAAARHPERIHLELAQTSLEQVQAAMDPTLEPQGLLARFRLGRRPVPSWLAARNLEGDILIDRFSINEVNLGSLSSRFLWQGTNIRFASLQVNLPEGLIRAQGNVNLSSYVPRLRLETSVAGFPWGGGILNAAGDLATSGLGAESIRNLRASGTFDGRDLELGTNNTFDRVSGAYEFSFAQGWPNLRLSNVEAVQEDSSLTGRAASNAEGKLLIDLDGAGRQLHFESPLLPQNAEPGPPAAPAAVAQK
ncbi:MAG: hypothetical protein JO319_04405 [Acidobacteriaceae bacterium]|nr:hypothetical protein [Acidobacteriaceae bacterium]